MNENTEKQETELPKQNNDLGDKSQNSTISIIEEANKAAERLEQANKRKEELIRREEEIEARRRLGGNTEINTEKPKEETPSEYIDRVMKGNY